MYSTKWSWSKHIDGRLGADRKIFPLPLEKVETPYGVRSPSNSVPCNTLWVHVQRIVIEAETLVATLCPLEARDWRNKELAVTLLSHLGSLSASWVFQILKHQFPDQSSLGQTLFRGKG
jgi:hypothetical protein